MTPPPDSAAGPARQPAPRSTPGRREQNKRRTRIAIRHSAMVLFASRGFDQVTTAQVAEQAGVSPATVFNYFASKEDLFFGQVRQLERELTELVAAVPPSASILTALQDHVLYELTAGRAYTDPRAVKSFHSMLTASSSLVAREAEIYERRARVLTAALRDAGLGLLVGELAARQYVAAEQLVAGELRRRLKGRAAPARVLAEMDAFVEQVFDLVRTGVGDLRPDAGHAP